VSHILIWRLAEVRSEFEVARASVEYLQGEWPRLHDDLYFKDLELKEVKRAVSNLEATYTVRLFTTFESMLRDFLPRPSPSRPDRRSAYDLINRTASRLHIPSLVRDEAHQVREYRNRTVHQGVAATKTVLFMDAMAVLNRFLSWLPNPP